MTASTTTARPTAPKRSRKNNRRRKIVITLLVLVALALVAAGLGWFRLNSLAGNVERIPNAFPKGVDRPKELPAAKGSETFLLVGSDSRSEQQTTGGAGRGGWSPGAQRTDTIMLVHLPKDREKAYIISIPRDSWVPVPGHGSQKVNAAYSYGGPPLLIETLEELTDVRIDHLAIIDFKGFRTMTTALGGVDVTVRQTTTDPRSGRTFRAGVNHLEGQAALDFVRQRYGLPRGDLDRVERQQSFMKALMGKAVASGTLRNPIKLDKFLGAATDAATVDEDLSTGKMRKLAFGLRGLRTNDVTFMTAPVSGLGREGAQSVVYLDEADSAELWAALRQDEVDEYVARHLGNKVSSVR